MEWEGCVGVGGWVVARPTRTRTPAFGLPVVLGPARTSGVNPLLTLGLLLSPLFVWWKQVCTGYVAPGAGDGRAVLTLADVRVNT